MTALALVDVGPAFAAALSTGTGRTFYYGRIPADAAAPFGVVQLVASSQPESLERFSSMVSQVVQISGVGKTHEDAAWLLDAARAYLDGLAMPLAVSAATQINSVVGEGPPSSPIEEGTLLTMNEDFRLLIGPV